MNCGKPYKLVVCFLSALLLLASCVRSQPVTTSPTQTSELPASTSQGRTFIVNSTVDNGLGTLRQALLDAKSGDTITFDPNVFPPEAPVTITLLSGLPTIAQGNLVIDASNAGVVLDGARIQETSANGLTITSNSNTIRGLQIIGFPVTGIILSGGAKDNTIGGDQHIGMGQLGQGNLVSGNKQGIALSNGALYNTILGNYVGTDVGGKVASGNWCGIVLSGANHNKVIGNVVSGNKGYGIELFGDTTRHNTISGNRVGTDASGENALGNQSAGVAIHDNASYNVIGPDNLIAYNQHGGILVQGLYSIYNTLTRNNIYKNGPDIELLASGNMDIEPPYFLEFDLGAGTVTGWAGDSYTVEIFSENSDGGVKIFEGQTIADSHGDFAFGKGSPFAGPRLVATATDSDGNTSEFSISISGIRKLTNLQEGISQLKTGIQIKRSKELEDNRIGSIADRMLTMAGGNAQQWLDRLTSQGLKRFKWSLNEAEERSLSSTGTINIDWSQSEFDIPSDTGGPDDLAALLAENGITSTYMLTFWDKANHPEGWEPKPGFSRFSTEEDIQRYLEYVRFIVRHFKGRIQCYELWNEPDRGGPLQFIEVKDYINLAKRVVPAIREEDPSARIVVGSIPIQASIVDSAVPQPRGRDYLFAILESDIMPLVDVVSWHPMFGVSPEYLSEYYYNYPYLVQEIKDVASAHGFKGEYRGEELNWQSSGGGGGVVTSQPVYSNIVATKYYARGIVMHLGMDLSTSHAGLATESFSAVRSLSILMAGAKPSNASIEIQSTATNTRNYSFSLPDGSQLVALWTDGVAANDDPGVKAMVTLQNVSAQKVVGIDTLNSFEQPLNVTRESNNLVIRDLLIKDYPIFLRLIP